MTPDRISKKSPVFWIGILILLALGAEVALRLLKIPGTSYSNWVPAVYQPHPTIGYTFIPDVVASYSHFFEWETMIKANSDGWRDYEHPLEKADGTFRIACIGDSYTVNLEVEMEDNYPKTLERILNKQASFPVEILNFSVDGTGTDSHLAMFEEYALKYKPDMVIHSFHDTDIVDVRNGITYRQGYKDMVIQYRSEDELKRGQTFIDKWQDQVLKRFFLRNSYLYRVVLHSFGIRWPQGYMVFAQSRKWLYTNNEALEKTKQLIRKFKALADENQIPYVMVFLHYEDAIRGEDTYQVKKKIKGLLEELRISYLDTYQPFKREADKRKLYWEYDPHITAEGCKLIAETVSGFLVQNNLLPSDMPGLANAGEGR